MPFLVGETRLIRALGRVEVNCRMCGKSRPAQRLAEINYFTLFTLPVLPLQRLADYAECTGCGESYATPLACEPAAHGVMRTLLAYIMLGYGGAAGRESLGEVFHRAAGVPVVDEELTRAIESVEQGGFAMFEFLKRGAYHLNLKGKEQVIEAAFLMTHASCEIQQQDRMRINLIGGAMGLSAAQVESVIERVRAARYYGVRRHLMPVTSVSR